MPILLTTESFPIVNHCTSCSKPLDIHSSDTNDLNYWEDDLIPLCLNCRKCISCHRLTTSAETLLCLQEKWPIQHARCMMLYSNNPSGLSIREDQKWIPSGNGSDISVHHSYFELLNLCRISMMPSEGLSEDTNTRVSETAHSQLIEQMSSEGKALHLKMIENIYGRCLLAIKKDPSNLRKSAIEREAKKFSDAAAILNEENKLKSDKKHDSSVKKETKKIETVMEKQLNSFLSILPRAQAIEQAKKVWESSTIKGRGPGTWTILE